MNCNSETEEETIAVNKKRARRVSFAENTSVHIFDRDEESESPTQHRTELSDVNPTELGLFNDELGFRRNSIDILRNNDDDVDDDDDDVDETPSFFRPMESPSSGSAFGSATSTDEDNFFGPVSASFIRPGRLSDSAPSDDNHEVTMDSTAFSMNFRSLAKSDSGGDLLTSTGVQLTFDEKTPTQNSNSINQGSTMALTVAKKPILLSSPPPAKLRSNSDSNDMSLVGEISRRYDYGGLSPGLDELLAQTSKDLHASGGNSYLESLRNIKSGLSPSSNQVFAHSNVDGEEFKERVETATHDRTSPIDIVSGSQNFSSIDSGTLPNLDNRPHKLGSELQTWNSPLINSLNSLSPKQRHIVDDNLNLSKSPWHVTPTLKQASYFVGSDDRVHKASASSIQKSFSKLELLQASPFSVTLSAKIGSSNLRPLHYLPRTPLGGELNSKISHVKDVDGDRGKSVIQEKGDWNRDKNIETPKDIRCIASAKALKSALKGARSPCNVSFAYLTADQQKKESGLATSLPQSICPPEQSEPHILSSDDPCEVKLVTFGIDASMVGVTLECMEGKGANGTPHQLTSSAGKRTEGKSSTLQTYLVTQCQEEFALRGDVDASFLGATVDNKESLSQHGRVQSSSPIVHSNHSKGSPIAENLNDGGINHPDYQCNFRTIKNSPTPLEHQVSHIFQSRTPNEDSETEREKTNARNDLAEEGGEVAFCSSNVSFSQKGANDLSIRKNLGKLFAQSPLGNKEQNMIPSNSIYPISVLGKLSSSPNQVTDVTVNSTRKRSNKNITPQDENTKAQKSPKLCTGRGDPVVSKPLNGGVSGRSTNGHVFKHWVDIQSKTSEVTENLFSLPVTEPSLQSIDALEDILVGLLRKQKYEMLCADMQSQKTHKPLNNHQHTRVVEAKLLLHKLVQEKAKLQLMHVKRDIMLKKVQIMRSAVQECEMLRSNHLILHPQKTLHIQADMHSQLSNDRQVLEGSERKITELRESFLVRCKIKGKPDPGDTVVLVNDYLTKRACYRFLRLDVQLWDIVHLENRNGHCNISLNYLDFITQRVNVKFCPVSVISISYELNNINIVKNLPGVDARPAFAFVFDAEPTRKYVSSRSLAEETQISSLLLGNVLDVVEEVQSAQLELRNLIQCTFCSESVEQLKLQLYFINLTSGRTAIFTFDLSCLKRGIYPSEIIPSIMEAPADENRKFCSKQLLAEAGAAVQSLKVGYLRIIRVCRCISQVFEASNC